MSTTRYDSEFMAEPGARFSWASTLLVEPLLVMAAALFWLVTLPFVVVSLVCVKVGDALDAMESAGATLPNPLMLRSTKSAPEGALVFRSHDPVRAGHA